MSDLPEGFAIIYDDYTDEVRVIYKGLEVYSWKNDANTDYPEDLTWDRLIGDVFWSGFNLGKNINDYEPKPAIPVKVHRIKKAKPTILPGD